MAVPAAQCAACHSSKSGLCGALLSSCKTAGAGLLNQRFATVRAGQQIQQSQSAEDVPILCEGWAFRYYQLPDGGRQILRFLLPGDLVFPGALISDQPSFPAKALTDVQVSRLARAEIRRRCLSDQEVMFAVFNSLAENGRDAYLLLIALGQRPADARIAHLLLSLMQRITAQRVITDHRYPCPLRQQHIADAVGLTPVHVNRVLSQFRERGILTLAQGILEVGNVPELERIGALT